MPVTPQVIANGTTALEFRNRVTDTNILTTKGALFAGTGDKTVAANAYIVGASGSPTSPNTTNQPLTLPILASTGVGDTGLQFVEANNIYVGKANEAVHSTNAAKLDGGVVGSATKPIYIDSNGKPCVCTAYSAASVNYATYAGKLTGGAVGDDENPIFINSSGQPQICNTPIAYGAQFARVLVNGTPYASHKINAGNVTTPVYINNGVPTVCQTYSNSIAALSYAGGSVYHPVSITNVSNGSTLNYRDTAIFHGIYLLAAYITSPVEEWITTIVAGASGTTPIQGTLTLVNGSTIYNILVTADLNSFNSGKFYFTLPQGITCAKIICKPIIATDIRSD